MPVSPKSPTCRFIGTAAPLTPQSSATSDYRAITIHLFDGWCPLLSDASTCVSWCVVPSLACSSAELWAITHVHLPRPVTTRAHHRPFSSAGVAPEPPLRHVATHRTTLRFAVASAAARTSLPAHISLPRPGTASVLQAHLPALVVITLAVLLLALAVSVPLAGRREHPRLRRVVLALGRIGPALLVVSAHVSPFAPVRPWAG